MSLGGIGISLTVAVRHYRASHVIVQYSHRADHFWALTFA